MLEPLSSQQASALGYWILPKTLDLLLGVSPPGVANLVTVDATTGSCCA